MTLLVEILSVLFLPMTALTFLGYLGRRIWKIDGNTLIVLNLYFFVPAVLFVKIVEARVEAPFVLLVLGFVLGIEAVMLAVSWMVGRVFGLDRSVRMAFGNSLLFFNSGNFGLPMADLAFHQNSTATAVQVFIMLFQNITGNTLGVFRSKRGQGTAKSALLAVFGLPALYVIVAAVLVKSWAVPLPAPLWSTLKFLSGGFVAIALITLGTQLADIRGRAHLPLALSASILRLVLSPLLGIAAAWALGLEGVLAQSLVLGISTPPAVNTAQLARRYDNEPELAAQTVLVGTALSGFTITATLVVVQILFPG